MNKLRSYFLFGIIICFAMTMMPVMTARAESPFKVGADDQTSFTSAEGGVFTYSDGTMTIAGAGLTGTDEWKTVEDDTEITVTLTPGEGYIVRELKYNGGAGLATLSDGENGTKTFTTTVQEDLLFEPLFAPEDESGGADDPATSHNISFILEGNACSNYDDMKSKDSTFELFFKPDGSSDFKTPSELVDGGQATVDDDGKLILDESITSVDAYVTLNTDQYLLAFIDKFDTGLENVQTISAKGDYRIQIDIKVLTVVWGYNPQIHGEDAFLEHGKAEVIAIDGNSDFSSIPTFANNPGDASGGHIAVPTGKQVTVKLTPDYGYQVSGVSLNGGETLSPQEDVSTFTFTMGAGQVHFRGIFTRVEDSIKNDGSILQSASIGNGGNAANSGTLQLVVNDNTVFDTAEAESLVTNAKSAQTIELELNNLVSKGDNVNYWVREVSEFTDPITISMNLQNYDSAYDYVVIRDHEGALTPLQTSISNGKVTFNTNQFSNYIIVKKEKAKTNTNTNTTTNTYIESDDNTDVSQSTNTGAKVILYGNTNNSTLSTWKDIGSEIEKLDATAKNNKTDTPLLKINVQNINRVVNKEVLNTLRGKNVGLHVFLGQGVAVTFSGIEMKNDFPNIGLDFRLSDQRTAVGKERILDFKEKSNLGVNVNLHMYLPNSTVGKTAKIYSEDNNKVRTLIGEYKISENHSICFVTNSKQKYVVSYE